MGTMDIITVMSNRSEVNIDGQEYYLYILTKATVIDGFKQIYQ